MAGGGRFGDGAMGAFASGLGGNAIASVGPGVRQAMVAAAVGGTASVIGGGKFANGAVSGAMVSMFNHQGRHETSVDQERNLSITDEQRELAATGMRREFWQSRLESGDPLAKTALDMLENNGWRAKIANWQFNRYVQRLGHQINVDQVSVDLMRAHVVYTDGASATGGWLSAQQVAEYHHAVFDRYCLPARAFGGTKITGSSTEARFTALGWCAGFRK